MASFSRTSECPVGPSQYRTGFVNLRVALSRKSTCRLTVSGTVEVTFHEDWKYDSGKVFGGYDAHILYKITANRAIGTGFERREWEDKTEECIVNGSADLDGSVLPSDAYHGPGYRLGFSLDTPDSQCTWRSREGRTGSEFNPRSAGVGWAIGVQVSSGPEGPFSGVAHLSLGRYANPHKDRVTFNLVRDDTPTATVSLDGCTHIAAGGTTNIVAKGTRPAARCGSGPTQRGSSA
jgi:hypothetical protein